MHGLPSKSLTTSLRLYFGVFLTYFNVFALIFRHLQMYDLLDLFL